MMEILTQQEITEITENFKNKYEGLGDVINPILKKSTLDRNRLIEVCQVGKYIHLLNEEIKIIDNPEPPAPDFILRKQNVNIGLEHTRIFTDDRERYLKIVSLIDKAESIYKEKYSLDFFLASIEIQNDKLDYKQNEKRRLATEIADLVYSVKGGLSVCFPNYVKNINISLHSQVGFYYKEQNYQSAYLTKQKLLEKIKNKENKIKLYQRSDFQISEYWLILLIGSLSSVSYQLNDNVDYRTNSLFDRVYLMSDFKGKIIRVK